jgi:hypothetical protein
VLAAGKALLVEHRNAGNSATVNTLGGVPAGASRSNDIGRVTLAQNERVVRRRGRPGPSRRPAVLRHQRGHTLRAMVKRGCTR